MQREHVTTVGIDIGTSTTKLVFSQLRIVNTAGRTRAPRFEIVERKVLYRSPMYRTPLKSERVIDIDKIWALIQAEYQTAGYSMSDVLTGAIIITGETATKQNANEVVSTLADRSGDFVVATAGPDLEGILAGKGSGAWQLSKRTRETVANVDIGGGTANIALFRRGEVLGTCTLHIGGRMVCFRDGIISRISEPVQTWANARGIYLHEGMEVLANQEAICLAMDGLAAILINVMYGVIPHEEYVLLLGRPPNWADKPNYVVFSGGVGGMLEKEIEAVDARGTSSFTLSLHERAFANDGFADCGLLLAHSLLRCKGLKLFERIEAVEALRATVIGAGTQSMEISGGTVYTEPSILPIKNCPVISCDFGHDCDFETELRNAVTNAKTIYDPEGGGQNYAFALKGISGYGFRQLQQVARAFRCVVDEQGLAESTLVVVVEGDVGKALGQCLVSENLKQIVCIDQIYVKYGDYIDIGVPFGSSEAVPVMVKTLVLDVSKGVIAH